MPDVPRRIVSMLLGSRVCEENADGDEICLYVNARSDGSVYVKVTRNGKKVAFFVTKPRRLIAALVPAMLTEAAKRDDIETLWSIVKGRDEDEEEEEEERGERKVKRRKAAKKERREKKRGEEEKEGVEEEEEEEIEFA